MTPTKPQSIEFFETAYNLQYKEKLKNAIIFLIKNNGDQETIHQYRKELFNLL